MNEPVVSVCVPLYNGGVYIDETLRTIACQSFRDFEVVVLDDCSSDDGPAIAMQWAAKDPRFRYVRNEANLGLVGNWNRCIEVATGEWIKFLFQDDLMSPDCLERMVTVGAAGRGFVASARRILYEQPVDDDVVAWYADHRAVLDDVYRGVDHLPWDAYVRQKIRYPTLNLVGEPSVTLIRRSLFAQYGPFDPLLVQLCDSEMWTRLAANVGVDFLHDELVTFRVHGSSASARYHERPFRGSVVDSIVEHYRITRSPVLQKFRDVARGDGKERLLHTRLGDLLNHAFDVVRNDERSGSQAASHREELDMVLDRLMGARRARLLHQVFRLSRRLGLASGPSGVQDAALAGDRSSG